MKHTVVNYISIKGPVYDIETSFNVLIITRVMSTLKDFIPGKM